MDQSAFFNMSYGLYIISSHDDQQRAGCVANTLAQVTASPAKMSITLNKDNVTEQVIEQSGSFSAVVLDMRADMDVIGTFGFKSSKDVDKFEAFAYQEDTFKNPYISEAVNAHFACKVVDKVDLGSHVMFIGEVVEADVMSSEESMTYAYYHTIKKGGTPKNAPSYQAPVAKRGWRCSVCGYIYEGDVLPEDFICPLCQAPACCFEKVV